MTFPKSPLPAANNIHGAVLVGGISGTLKKVPPIAAAAPGGKTPDNGSVAPGVSTKFTVATAISDRTWAIISAVKATISNAPGVVVVDI